MLRTVANVYNEHILCPMNFVRLAQMLFRHGRALCGPLRVAIDITNRCDMGCIMCWYHSPYYAPVPETERDFPLERFSLLMGELRQIGVRVVLLSGAGEPFMHPHIFSMIDTARKEGIDVEIMTNGYHLNDDSVESLAKLAVKKIMLSLHCASEEAFLKVRPLKSAQDFLKIKRNLLSLRALRKKNKQPSIYIINVISRINFKDIPAMAALAGEINADKVFLKPLTCFNEEMSKNLTLSAQDMKDLGIILAHPLIRKIGIPNNIKDYWKVASGVRRSGARKLEASQKPTAQRCYIPWTQAVIGLDGGVIGCVYAGLEPLGNIYQADFRTIWQSSGYQKFRRGFGCPSRCLGKAVYPLLA